VLHFFTAAGSGSATPGCAALMKLRPFDALFGSLRIEVK
jgi:hypothetical protein